MSETQDVTPTVTVVKETPEKLRIGTGLPGPGRVKGVPNKVSLEAKTFFLRIVRSKTYQRKLFKAALERTLPPKIEELVLRGAGWAVEGTKINVEDNRQVTMNFRNYMTPEEKATVYARMLAAGVTGNGSNGDGNGNGDHP